MIHHLVTAQEWCAAGPGCYRPPSLATEGFVHCAGDVPTALDVANRFYRHLDGEVLLLDLDEARLSSEVVWEPPAHPDRQQALADEPTFPHVYGPIDLGAVVEVRRFLREPDGTYLGVVRT